MLILLSSLIVAAVLGWTSLRIVHEIKTAQHEAALGRTAQLLTLFAPAAVAVQTDPRALLAWEPLARMARQLFPQDFVALDGAAGTTFPFNAEAFQSAHAQWTADWLAWECLHDADYKLKAAALERELRESDSTLLRARIEAVEREKLDLYQRRYAEYIRVAKALQACVSKAGERRN